MTHVFQDIFLKISKSATLAWAGKENIKIVLWYWGLLGYLISYFILDKLIKWNHIRFFDIIISLAAIAYFVWHIIVIRKCKPKINKEQTAQDKKSARKEAIKSFLRKVFLKEPITKWHSETIMTVTDIFAVTVFAGYIFG